MNENDKDIIDILEIDNLTYIKTRDPKFEARAIRSLPNEDIMLHYHDDIEITCQLEGNSTHIVNERHYLLRENELLVINNHFPHYNHAFPEDVRVIVVIISEKYLNNMIIESGFDPQIIDLVNALRFNKFEEPIVFSPKLRAILNDMDENNNDHRIPSNPYKQRLLIGLFLVELTNLGITSEYQTVKDNNDLISYILSNIQTANLNAYARKLNYSVSFTSRKIKADYDATFLEILHEMRLQKAARLLISSDVKIENIMHQIGYTNKTHFYQLFKSRYEMTPSKYRKQNIN